MTKEKTTKYKIKVDKNHPAGTVVFLLPDWATKENPANADDCFIWNYQYLLTHGLKDGDEVELDPETGRLLVEVNQEKFFQLFEEYNKLPHEVQKKFWRTISYEFSVEEEEKQMRKEADICLGVIKMLKGEEFLQEVKTCIKESDFTYNFELVDYYKGELTDDFYFCHQTENGGHTGDSFAGHIYIPIVRDQMFLKFKYEM